MNILPAHVSRFTTSTSPAACRRSGSAVIVVLALLAIMLIYVTANLRTLHSLGGELRLLENRQVQRLQKSAAATRPAPVPVSTNAVAPAPPP
jgi:hypothetical protein